MPTDVVVRMRLAALAGVVIVGAGCTKPPAWNVGVLAQGDGALVGLSAADSPRGPAHVVLDGERMEVVDRGGTRLTFLLGASAFGPSWVHASPSYRVTFPRGDAPVRSTLKVDGTPIEVELENLRTPVIFTLVTGAPLRPGQEVALRYAPGPDFPSTGRLHVYFRASGSPPGEWRVWAADYSSKFAPIRWEAGQVMRFVVPSDAPPGPGELLVNGELRVVVSRCDGASSCHAGATVSSVVPVEISTAADVTAGESAATSPYSGCRPAGCCGPPP